MVIGILVGPVFNVVAPAFFLDKAGFLLSLALVLVLLESGLSLDLAKTIRNASGALFLTVLTLILSTVMQTASAAVVASAIWVGGVITAEVVASEPYIVFGATAQLVFAVLAVLLMAGLIGRRDSFEVI